MPTLVDDNHHDEDGSNNNGDDEDNDDVTNSSSSSSILRMRNRLKKQPLKADRERLAKLKHMMEEAGFEDVYEARFGWPSNPYWVDGTAGGNGGSSGYGHGHGYGYGDGYGYGYGETERSLGELQLRLVRETGHLESEYGAPLAESLGGSRERARDLLRRAKAEMADPRVKAYTPGCASSFFFFFLPFQVTSTPPWIFSQPVY